MHDTFSPTFTPEYAYEAMLDFARNVELELNAANGRIAELETKIPPHECPQESVTLLAANHQNLAEYLASLESRLARITDHYNILRADLVEREARDLHGAFQAAANHKDIDTCRVIANAKLRGICSGCEGRGEIGGQFPDGSHQTDPCPHCEGNGFVEIPELPSGIELATQNRPDIESIVCDDIKRRQQLGLAKYGTTVANNPLSLREWLVHQYSELLDAAIYARRAIDEIDRNAANEPNVSALAQPDDHNKPSNT